MKEIRMRAFFGMIGLAAAGFLASSVATTGGCSSSSSTGTAGTTGSHGGSTGTAGTSSGAGTTGSGGASTGGSGGSAGGGGANATLGCVMSDPAPGAPTIADFETVDAGNAALMIGGTFTYGPGVTTAVVAGGWHITATVPGTTSNQYSGAGIYFNGNPTGTDCVDASIYTGVQFDIKGTVTGAGCSMQYATNDAQHADMTQINPSTNMADPKAGGPMGSYAPQAPVTVTTTSTPVMMPFMGVGAPTGGSPNGPVDRGRLTGVQWQFTTMMGATNACAVDITIDNVKFY